MADIDPPSFSLGIDLDFPPTNDIIPPSFSLGLGLEFEPDKSNQQNDPLDDSLYLVPDSDRDSPVKTTRPRFRRLRRGLPPISTPPVLDTNTFVDDDIEDFSDDEIVPSADPFRATQHQTFCSSSKLPLSGSGVLRRPQKSTSCTTRSSQRKEDSSCLPSTSVASNKGKSVFPDFTSSPLRRFQLLDSDSDDPSECVIVEGNASKVNLSKNIMQTELNQKSSKIAFAQKTDLSASTSQKQDLWKTFHVDNNVSVPTPVFDKLLEEYCEGGNQNNGVSGSHEIGSSGMASSINNARNFKESETLETAGLPCHRYFFHDDDRIQRLVRSRLRYFCPLGVSHDTGNASSIDYRSQFCTEDGATANQRAGRNLTAKKSSKRPQKRNKKANAVEDLHAAGIWIDPKQTANTPTVAGKRRVLADGQSAGHWFTGDNGKKVYVTKTGKELTGRLAYMQFTKENGRSRKPKKKCASKKK